MTLRQPLRRLAALVAILLPLLVLPGCEEADVIFLKIDLRADLSGTFTVCGVEVPEEAPGYASETEGVHLSTAARLTCAGGTFDSISGVRFGDLTFSAVAVDGGTTLLQVTLPRGKDASWARLLVPMDEEKRRDTLKILDPKGRAGRVGAMVKLEITVAGRVVSRGVQPILVGVEENYQGGTCSLVVPVARVQEGGKDITWHLTWTEEKG